MILGSAAASWMPREGIIAHQVNCFGAAGGLAAACSNDTRRGERLPRRRWTA